MSQTELSSRNGLSRLQSCRPSSSNAQPNSYTVDFAEHLMAGQGFTGAEMVATSSEEASVENEGLSGLLDDNAIIPAGVYAGILHENLGREPTAQQSHVNLPGLREQEWQASLVNDSGLSHQQPTLLGSTSQESMVVEPLAAVRHGLAKVVHGHRNPWARAFAARDETENTPVGASQIAAVAHFLRVSEQSKWLAANEPSPAEDLVDVPLNDYAFHEKQVENTHQVHGEHVGLSLLSSPLQETTPTTEKHLAPQLRPDTAQPFDITRFEQNLEAQNYPPGRSALPKMHCACTASSGQDEALASKPKKKDSLCLDSSPTVFVEPQGMCANPSSKPALDPLPGSSGTEIFCGSQDWLDIRLNYEPMFHRPSESISPSSNAISTVMPSGNWFQPTPSHSADDRSLSKPKARVFASPGGRKVRTSTSGTYTADQIFKYAQSVALGHAFEPSVSKSSVQASGLSSKPIRHFLPPRRRNKSYLEMPAFHDPWRADPRMNSVDGGSMKAEASVVLARMQEARRLGDATIEMHRRRTFTSPHKDQSIINRANSIMIRTPFPPSISTDDYQLTNVKALKRTADELIDRIDKARWATDFARAAISESRRERAAIPDEMEPDDSRAGKSPWPSESGSSAPQACKMTALQSNQRSDSMMELSQWNFRKPTTPPAEAERHETSCNARGRMRLSIPSVIRRQKQTGRPRRDVFVPERTSISSAMRSTEGELVSESNVPTPDETDVEKQCGFGKEYVEGERLPSR